MVFNSLFFNKSWFLKMWCRNSCLSQSADSGQSDWRIPQHWGVIIRFVPQLGKFDNFTFWRTSRKTCGTAFTSPSAHPFIPMQISNIVLQFSESFLDVFHDSATKAPLLISAWQHLAALYTLQDKYPRQMMCRQLEMCKVLISEIFFMSNI